MRALFLAVILAIVGGGIGLFCYGFSLGFGFAVMREPLPTNLYRGLYGAYVHLTSLLWLFAVPIALCGTILLPPTYYLTRRFWPVTPLRYAATGAGLGLILFLVSVGWPADPATRYSSFPAAPYGSFWIGFASGTVLAGAICGLLFGWLMQEYYQRYLRTRIEKA